MGCRVPSAGSGGPPPFGGHGAGPREPGGIRTRGPEHSDDEALSFQA